MSDERTLHISLQLDAHKLALNVPMSQEGIYRDAAKMLNRRYEFYLHRMPNTSAEKLWVYVALETACALKSDARAKSIEPVVEQIDALNQLIEQQL